jgi:hypothetical protein
MPASRGDRPRRSSIAARRGYLRLSLRAVAGIVLAVSLGFAAAIARADAAPPQPVPLGAGATLSITPFKRPRSATTELVALPVTIANHGAGTIRLKYRQFLLTDGAGQKSMALLPSELQFEKTSARPLAEGTVSSGSSSSGVLYFHLPSAFIRPIWLRVDLESADGTVLGQTMVPL